MKILIALLISLATISASYAENSGPAYPTTGTGVTLDLGKDISADVTYNHIQPTDINAKMEDPDFFGVGLNFSLD